MEVSGILDRGQLVLLTAQHKSWKFDLVKPVPDIKMVTCLEIVQYHGGRALSGHAGDALSHGPGSG